MQTPEEIEQNHEPTVIDVLPLVENEEEPIVIQVDIDDEDCPQIRNDISRVSSLIGKQNDESSSFLNHFDIIADRKSTLIDMEKIADYFENNDISGDSNKYTFFSKDIGALKGNSIKSLNLGSAGNLKEILLKCPFWIDILDPTEKDLHAIEKTFGIHPLTIEDILSDDSREKCDVFSNYYFVVIKSFSEEDEYQGLIKCVPVSIIVFGQCILSFQSKDNSHSMRVIERLQKRQKFDNDITPDSICYTLLDEITDKFVPLIKYMENDCQSIDDLVAVLKASDQSDMLQRISFSQKRVMLVSRLMNGKPELIRLVITRIKSKSEYISMYLEDIYDHAVSMKQDLNQFDISLERAHSNYLAQISIEINLVSNRGNKLAGKMTMIASVILPMQIITGLWGMNVRVPGQLDGTQDSGIWFFIILTFMVLVSIITMYAIKKFVHS